MEVSQVLSSLPGVEEANVYGVQALLRTEKWKNSSILHVLAPTLGRSILCFKPFLLETCGTRLNRLQVP